MTAPLHDDGRGLTEAQVRFMKEAARGINFEPSTLRGSEWLMAERLVSRGMVEQRRDPRQATTATI